MRQIVSQKIDLPISTLPEMIKEQIDLNPDFQRRDRWDVEKQSRFIESIIINVPIPPVFLGEDQYGKYVVLDGRQRLTAIETVPYQPVVQVALFRQRLEWLSADRGGIRMALGGALRLRQRRTGHEGRENSSRNSRNSALPRFFHSRGVPAPSNLRKIRLRLNAATWINCRLRMFACLRRCVRRIPPVS